MIEIVALLEVVVAWWRQVLDANCRAINCIDVLWVHVQNLRINGFLQLQNEFKKRETYSF